MTVLQHWTLRQITGGPGTISHPWWTTAPGCPQERHATRWCKCRPHRSKNAALAYIREQEQKEAQNEQH